MHITNFDSFRDGGTIVYTTDVGNIYQDFRIGTKEEGTVWYGYPENAGSRKLSEEDVVEFWEALYAFGNWHRACYDKSIEALRSVYNAPNKRLSTMDTVCMCGESTWRMSSDLPKGIVQCSSCTRKWPQYITLRERI